MSLVQQLAERVSDSLSGYVDISRPVDAFDRAGTEAHGVVVARRAESILRFLDPERRYEVSVRSFGVALPRQIEGGTMPILGSIPYHLVVKERSAIDRLGELCE